MYAGHADQRLGHSFYSQWGQDVFILNLCQRIGLTPENCRYLDLGSHHPYTISNTALLYERGYRGVNVEANPALMEEFRKHRPEDLNVNIGVGPDEGVAPFYMYSATSGLNGFVKGNIERHKGYEAQSVIELPVTTFENLVKTHCTRFPEILLTDIEGYDFEILKKIPPREQGAKIICSEIRSENRRDVLSMMTSKGYLVVACMGEDILFLSLDSVKNYYG